MAVLVGAGLVATQILLSAWLPMPPASVQALISLLGAGFAYWSAFIVLSQRLELARKTLKEVRKHRFESLRKLSVARGDELSALVWQVYRTGLTLEKEIGELRKMENYRREFLGNVSHELKTPLFAVKGFAETLLDGALDDERVRRTFVEKILRNTERLHALTNDLHELSRLETGELTFEKAPFSVVRVAQDVVESLDAKAHSRGLSLTLRADTNVPAALGDRDRIRQVLTNLIDNAIKYTQTGGHVDVRIRQEGERVITSVQDTGVGLAPQHIPRVTERFYRVDKSRSRDEGGTGLGLAIVKHILAAHQTQLLIESQMGQGSAFTFALPRAERVTPAPSEGEARS